ncbi:MAG: hypothetical protein WC861_05555 [Candidatus Micrarchaeia archaeon]|jgi:hypothetical protein
MAKLFGKEYLQDVFQRIGARLGRKTTAFVLGGGAMCFRNQKTGTKDLDIVFTGDPQAKAFFDHARKEGFSPLGRIGNEYRMMKAYGILENKDEFRFDIFSGKVCGALALSKGMIARSEGFGAFGKLEVRLVSNEDVILFKGITQRARDADDIAAVIRSSSIDWRIILEECKAQSGSGNWYGLLYDKLAEIRAKHGIRAPIMGGLLKLDNQSALEEAYARMLKGGASRADALKELKRRGFRRKELASLS